MTNARHVEARDHTAVLIAALRVDIAAQLMILVTLTHQLDDLADTRQAMGLGFQTAEAREARARQDAADRAAARGHSGRITRTGLGWMNPVTIAASGPTEAPVTMPAVSVSAQILMGLRHRIRRLARPAFAALRTEPGIGTPGAATPAAARLAATRVDPADASVDYLANRLLSLVEITTRRAELEAILRDLEHMTRLASDVVDGPARTNHPDVCPWCGRSTLVIHHREPGRDAAFIRCEGNHACRCNYEWCPCQRPGNRDRHEWINSRHATNDWHQLRRDQEHRRDEVNLERIARDTLDEIRALHQRLPLFPVVDDCPSATDHSAEHWAPDPETGEAICTACPPAAFACSTCRDPDGWYHPWPCVTATAPGDAQDATDATGDGQ